MSGYFVIYCKGMKIYTRTGDQGTTGLFGGQRVPKDNPRIEAYGTIDELNSALGAVTAFLPTDLTLPLEIGPVVETIQQDLLAIGSHLATPYQAGQVPDHLPDLRPDAITWMEDAIDRLDDHLPELHQFILPGGSQAGSLIHVARTVCRRAERRVTALAAETYVDPEILRYLNRLSDFLFNLARSINLANGDPEILWQPRNYS